MFNYCRNLSGLLGMFSLFIQKEINQQELSKEEYSSAVIHFIEKNGATFRHQYCTHHCEKKEMCSLSSCQKRASV